MPNRRRRRNRNGRTATARAPYAAQPRVHAGNTARRAGRIPAPPPEPAKSPLPEQNENSTGPYSATTYGVVARPAAARFRTGGPAPPRDCAAATRPPRPNGPARAANRSGHWFESFCDGARSYAHDVPPPGRQRGMRHFAPGSTHQTRYSLRTKPAPRISRVRRRAEARNGFPA